MFAARKATQSPCVCASVALRHRGVIAPVQFTLPELGSAGDASRAMAAITEAVAHGELTPTEAGELSRLIETYVKVLEVNEFDQRLRVLENGQLGARANPVTIVAGSPRLRLGNTFEIEVWLDKGDGLVRSPTGKVMTQKAFDAAWVELLSSGLWRRKITASAARLRRS